MNIGYRTLYGRDTAEQSALNLVMLLGTSLGDSDERYRIEGGNDRLVQSIAARLRRPALRCAQSSSARLWRLWHGGRAERMR